MFIGSIVMEFIWVAMIFRLDFAGLSSRKEIVGKRNKDLPWNSNAGVLPETLDRINREVMEPVSQKSSRILPVTLYDGTEVMFLSDKAPIRRVQNRDVIGMVGISIDITT